MLDLRMYDNVSMIKRLICLCMLFFMKAETKTSVERANLLRSLFRPAAQGVPSHLVPLWLVEEARAQIAVKILSCRRWRHYAKNFPHLLYLHVRLYLIIKMIGIVETSCGRTDMATDAQTQLDMNAEGVIK